MNASNRLHSHVSWTLVAWLLSILSGGLMTSLLRAPLALGGALPSVATLHTVGGAAVGLLAIGHVTRSRLNPWGRGAFVAATLTSGWLAHRSLSPPTSASHAALAAFTTLALVGVTSRTSPRPDPAWRRWTSVLAVAGFVLLLVQLAAGAALRQHLIGLPLHLLLGGLVSLIVLGSAAATLQHQDARSIQSRAARSAIAAVLVQVTLGVTILFMMLLGEPNAGSWISVTVAHVVMGTITLLAVGSFTRILAGRR